MVIAYVEAHGEITRAQAAELCAIAPAQAGRLLRRLASQGKLVKRGERRGSFFYERPTA
jgi:ATP-dependent DNA helicase RecG